ncbi:gins complex subunit [Grosmannia clavigera kw1407]|uniref:DNA replication complex GINS protein PSF3 n=1 Tax=Grosmannia clavigera (strain kw1407 / UAMH 11150) TaxID=655863 RepID=F0XV69_GROCL|nr:gins complex subunit [Grosmannia clavigera kw1407]EFW98858.1 gins complex subunit [Grosmannia clavigera kw1407]
MSYYDIDAILTDAEKIPCEFQIDVPGLGYLDQTPSHSLRRGTRLGLPLWLAEMLALAHSASDDNPPFLTLNLPPALTNDVVQALKADPRSVPLRDQSAHFYSLATRILDLFEERDLAVVLRTAFVGRSAEIGLHARKVGYGSAGGGSGSGSNTSNGDKKDDTNSSNLGIGSTGQEFLRGLDEWERQLFRHAHDGAKSGREFLDSVKRNY